MTNGIRFPLMGGPVIWASFTPGDRLFLRRFSGRLRREGYLHSIDPLFDLVTLGYVLHRGTIRERNKQLRGQGITSHWSSESNWQESSLLIRFKPLRRWSELLLGHENHDAHAYSGRDTE